MLKGHTQEEIIMALRSQGLTQADVAHRLGLTQPRISQIEQRMTARLPVDVTKLRDQLVDQLDRARAAAEDLMHLEGAPVVKTVSGGEEGSSIEYVVDPETGDYIRSYDLRLKAIRELVRVQERMAKLLGVDSPTQVETAGTVRYEIAGLDPDTIT